MSPSLPLAFHPELPPGPLPANGGPSLAVPNRTTSRVHRDIRLCAKATGYAAASQRLPQYIITAAKVCQEKIARLFFLRRNRRKLSLTFEKMCGIIV